MCTAGGLAVAAVGAVGLAMTALVAPRAHDAPGVVAQGAITTVQKRHVPTAIAPAGEVGFSLEDGSSAPSDGGIAGPCAGGVCPLSTFDGIYGCLNQNCDKADAQSTVACGSAGNTTENKFARCFDLLAEGFVPGMELNTVKWGVQQYTDLVNSISVSINVYSDVACPPSVTTAVLLGSVVETVNPGDAGKLFFSKPLTQFGAPIILTSQFVVLEIEAAQDGTVAPLHAFRPISSSTACADAYLLSVSCGIAEWTSVTAIGFPDSQILLSANLNVPGAPKPLCSNGIVEACEQCDDGNLIPGDGCDENCQVESFCGDGVCDPGETECNCAADCGAPPVSEAGLCSNAIDDDCDGLTDCDDPDCANDIFCTSGACCPQDGTCLDVPTQADCDALLGHFTVGQVCVAGYCQGQACNWDNGPPFGTIRGSQCATDFFAAGRADDFILSDIDGPNPCQIDMVTVWTGHWNPGVIDPNLTYTGVNVTIYADGGIDGLTKGPGGQPDDPPDPNCQHTAYWPGGIIYSQQIPMALVSAVETGPGTDVWQLDIPVNIILKKKVKYWLEVQPIVLFAFSQAGVQDTDQIHGHTSQSGFPAAGVPFWTDTGADMAFILAGHKVQAPFNDDCNFKKEIVDGWVHFDTTGATTDGIDHPPGTCGPFGDGNVHNDIWYNYTAKCDGDATFSLCKKPNFDTRIAIYDGCGVCPPTALLGCDDDSCTGGAPWTSTITIPVLTGNCYTVRVGGFSAGDFGNGTLSVECGIVAPPCPKDFTITAPGSFPGDTCGAGNDIFLRPSEDQSFTVTIPNDGLWTFTLCTTPPAVLWDSHISLGTACGLDDIALNDDTCGLMSEVTANLVAGDYWVTIEGFGAADCGAYTLDISKQPIQPCDKDNDTCATPFVIPGLPFKNVGDTTFCTDDYNEVCPFTVTGGQDVVYSYTPAVDQIVDITLCQPNSPTAYDTKLYVYANLCPDPGFPIACSDDACATALNPFVSEVLGVPMLAGNIYYIIVDAYSGADMGIYDLHVEEAVPAFGACCFADGTCLDAQDVASCAAAGGAYQGDGTDCASVNCPVSPKCMLQPPNQVNGLFSDLNCPLCGTGLQIIADNFNIFQDDEIDFIRFWGGYFSDNIPMAVDAFTVIFRADAAGAPGAVINTIGPIGATSRATTGVILFGVDEYVYTIALDPNKALAPGTYWIEIYNDTAVNPANQWFWETGNLDVFNGILGSAWTPTLPEPPWNLDPATDLAIELVCKPHCCNADLNGDCQVTSADLTILLGAWASGTAAGDVDKDGDTDSADLTLLLGAWAAGNCAGP